MTKCIQRIGYALAGFIGFAPIAYGELARHVTVDICADQVFGYCRITTDNTDMVTSVRFGCTVRSSNHFPMTILDKKNFDIGISGGSKITTTLPKAGPVHMFHQYCRYVEGFGLEPRIKFKPAGSLPHKRKCKLYVGAEYTNPKRYLP